MRTAYIVYWDRSETRIYFRPDGPGGAAVWARVQTDPQTGLYYCEHRGERYHIPC